MWFAKFFVTLQSNNETNINNKNNTNMKKRIYHLMLAAIIACGAMTLTSCSIDDNPVIPDSLAEKIIGKWMTADFYGVPVPTNNKMSYTFVSTTKGYISASLNSRQESASHWNEQSEVSVAINGNKVTVTSHPEENRTEVEEYTITAINDSEFNANRKITITADGVVVISVEQSVRFVKQTADYSAAIVGTWQGRCTSEGSVFDDGQEHRWQYKADGTYVYYVKDGDNWVPYATNTLNEYFVDGTLLCTRWIDLGQENREWWEITINGDKMNWTALRENPDGTTFTATFEMKKVE